MTCPGSGESMSTTGAAVSFGSRTRKPGSASTEMELPRMSVAEATIRTSPVEQVYKSSPESCRAVVAGRR